MMNETEDDEADLASIVQRSKLRRDFLAQSKLEIDSFALEIAAETTKAKESLRKQLSSSGDGFGERVEKAVAGSAGGGVSARTKKLWDFGSDSGTRATNANVTEAEEDVREAREESSGGGSGSVVGAASSAIDNGTSGSILGVAEKDDDDSQAREQHPEDSVSLRSSLQRTAFQDSRRDYHQIGQLRYSQDQDEQHQDRENEDDFGSVTSSYSDIAASLRREMRQVITQQAKLEMEQLTLDAAEMRKRVQHFRPVLKGEDGMRVVVDSTATADASAPKRKIETSKDGGFGRFAASVAPPRADAKASSNETNSPKETNNYSISEWKKKVNRLLNQDDKERAIKSKSDHPKQHEQDEEDAEEYMGIELRLTQTYSQDDDDGLTDKRDGANKNHSTSSANYNNFYSNQEEELPIDEEVHGPDSKLRQRRRELFRATGNSDIDCIIQKFQTARMKHSVEAQNISKFHQRPAPPSANKDADIYDGSEKWKKPGYRGINEDHDLISTGSTSRDIQTRSLDDHASPRTLRMQRVKEMKNQIVAPSPGAHSAETEKAATHHRQHGSDDDNKKNGEMEEGVLGTNSSSNHNPYATPKEDQTGADDGVKTFGGKLNQWWRRQKGLKNFDEKNGLTDEILQHQSRNECNERNSSGCNDEREQARHSSPIPAPLLIPSLLPSSPPSRHDGSDDRRDDPPKSAEGRNANSTNRFHRKKTITTKSSSGPLGLPPPSPRSNRIRKKSLVKTSTNNNLSSPASNTDITQTQSWVQTERDNNLVATNASSGKRNNIFRRGPPCPEGNAQNSSMRRIVNAIPPPSAAPTAEASATPSPSAQSQTDQPLTAPANQRSRSPPLTIIDSTQHKRFGSINSSASNLSEDESQAGNNSQVSSLEPQSVAQSAMEVILGRIEEAKCNFQKALVEDDVEKQTEMAALIAKLGEAAVAMRKLEQS